MRGLLTSAETNNILCCCATLHQRSLIHLVIQNMKQLHGEKLMRTLLEDLPSIMSYMRAIQPAGDGVKAPTVQAGQALRLSPLNEGAPFLHTETSHLGYAETASNYECPSCSKLSLFGRTCCDQCRQTSGTHHRDCIYDRHSHWSRRTAASSSSATPYGETSDVTAQHQAQECKGIDMGNATTATIAHPPH